MANLRDDVIRLSAAIGIVRDRQHRFDHIGIGVAVFGWQYNDGLCEMWTCNLEIVRIDGTSASADDTRLSFDLDPLLYLILYLHLIFIRQDDNACVGLIFIGSHQFIEDSEDLRRPSQHKGMI